MKLKFIFGIFVLFSYFSQENIEAQTKDSIPEKQCVDTVVIGLRGSSIPIPFYYAQNEPMDAAIAKKGDLIRLIKDIYVSFMSYHFGKRVALNNDEAPPIIILYSNTNPQETIVPIQILDTIDTTSIDSITVCYGYQNSLYGTRGLSTCIFKIKLKDKTE
jgi:hypothetical protein